MTKIRLVSSEPVDFGEGDLQRAFEAGLHSFEEGLRYVASEVTLGTGRIDTLAVDSENRPVLIEYKREGPFDQGALIQLMDYLSWFVRDENHILVLEKYIRSRKPEIENISREIRLICVVSSAEERVKNACYVVGAPLQIVSYVATQLGDEVIVVPKIELDNTEVEVVIEPHRSEDELLRDHQHLEPIYRKIRAAITEFPGVDVYTRARSIRFKASRVFAKLKFRKQYIFTELCTGPGISDDRFKYWRGGESPWGYLHIGREAHIDRSVKEWIERAYRYRGTETAPVAEEDN